MIGTSVLLLFLLGVLCPFQAEGSHHSSTSPTPSSHQNIPFADESFRSLQSAEDSEEMINQCCGRVPQYETIGYGLDGTQLRVDVGSCRQSCHKAPLRPLKREEFDKYLKRYPNMDPVHIFLALQSRVSPTNTTSLSSSSEEELEVDTSSSLSPSSSSFFSLRSSTGGGSASESSSSTPTSTTASCLDAICRPSSTRRELHFGVGGVQYQVEVVESCDCVQLPTRSCSKVSKSLRLHPDTPFETVVDVGECVGGAGCGGDSTFCRPIRNRTVSVEGPNGVECIQVIEECSCTGGCYRMKDFFKVYDFSSVFEQQEQTPTNDSAADSSLNDNLIPTSHLVSPSSSTSPSSPASTTELPGPSEPLTKIIDVGRCKGSCESGGKQGHSTTSKCLLRSSSGSCLSSLYGAQPSCAPTKLHTHFYKDRKGRKHSIISVTSCGCN